MYPKPRIGSDSPWRAWWNGHLVSPASISISMYDAGFIQGLTVAEQFRTFDGRVFQLESHLERLERSLEIVGVDPNLDRQEWREIVELVAETNFRHVLPGDDLGIGLWVTPGTHHKFADFAAAAGPQICCYAHPLQFANWHAKYQTGDRLVTVDHRQISPENWPPELKCRSRMHYYLAERQARQHDPLAAPLLLDLEGFVCESSIANVLAVFPGPEIVSPRIEKILPGVSLQVFEQLAGELAIPFRFDDMPPQTFATAEEILLCSTSPSLLPVTRLDDAPVGKGEPGRVFRKLLAALGRMVGLDVEQQAAEFADRINR